MCNFICQHDFSKPTLSRLDEWLIKFDITKGGHATAQEIENHEFCEKGVTVQTNHSKMQKLLLQIEAAAHHANQMARVPADYDLITNLLAIVYVAHRPTWDRLLHLIDTHDFYLDTMTYEQATSLILKAENQPSARSTAIAKIRSLMEDPAVGGSRHTNTGHESAKSDKPDSTKSDKSPPVYFQVNCQPQGPAKYYILEGLVGPGVLASESTRKKAHDEGGCSNCLTHKYKKYGPHTAETCPYTTPDLRERLFSHTPITVDTTGRQGPYLVVSDPTTLQKFRDERQLLLSRDPPVQTTPANGGKGGKGGSQHVSTPHETTRQLFPMLRTENPEQVEDITTPEDLPAKGPIGPSAWARSANPHYH